MSSSNIMGSWDRSKSRNAAAAAAAAAMWTLAMSNQRAAIQMTTKASTRKPRMSSTMGRETS